MMDIDKILNIHNKDNKNEEIKITEIYRRKQSKKIIKEMQKNN